MHKATHLEGEPEGGFFAKYSKLLGTGLAASLNAIGEIDLTMCKFENFSSTQRHWSTSKVLGQPGIKSFLLQLQ